LSGATIADGVADLMDWLHFTQSGNVDTDEDIGKLWI